MPTAAQPAVRTNNAGVSTVQPDNSDAGTPSVAVEVEKRHPMKEFCRSTSMHGLQYLVKEGTHQVERTFWMATLLMSLLGCAVLAVRTYGRWTADPIVASNKLTMYPIWAVPFPAVTICSETKLGGIPEEDLALLQLSLNKTKALLCEDRHGDQGDKTLTNADVDFLVSVAPKFRDIVVGFSWRGKLYANLNETEGFSGTGYHHWTPILTAHGLCYTSNMLHPEELFTELAVQRAPLFPDEPERATARGWGPSRGYDDDAFVDTAYPARSLGGFRASLRFLVCTRAQDVDTSCRGPVQGFQIALHNPAEVPQTRQFMRAPLVTELLVYVKPSMLSTSDDLLGFDPFQRGCYFAEDRQLSYFRVYTRRNCEMECASNFSRGLCGCVPFYMPQAMTMADVGSGPGCHCLPDCTAVDYDYSAQLTEMYFGKTMTAYKYEEHHFDGKICARTAIYVRDSSVFASNQRNELYPWEKFIADTGSVLGLFTGFSFINVVEMAYFFGLGLLFTVWQKCTHIFAKGAKETAQTPSAVPKH